MCGICGAISDGPLALESIISQLTRVNHRGHEAVGIAAVNSTGDFVTPSFIGPGLVRDACSANQPRFRQFSDRFFANQPCAFVGHTRYPTVGPSNDLHGQPLKMNHVRFGDFYLVHNGQIPNHRTIRDRLEAAGQRFMTESDSEVLAALIAHAPDATLPEAVATAMREVPGAYSLLVLGQHHLVAARDQHGVWPLWCGTALNGDRLFASEEGALGVVRETAEIQPGSLHSYRITQPTLPVLQNVCPPCPHQCWVNTAYFARPDEGIGSRAIVADVRFALGESLARECRVEVDMAVGVPDSGMDAAQGFAQASGIPLQSRALLRNRFAPGRSFILPGSAGRQNAVLDKQSVTRRKVQGQRVAVVDDTVVRSTTARTITKMFREVGAREVHWCIAAPPIRFPCFYGINTPNIDELVGHHKNGAEIARDIGADSLHYLSLGAMLQTLNRFQAGWCTACVTNEYPIPLT